MQGWLLGLKAISDQTSNNVDCKVDWMTVPGVLDLRNVFELVHYRFNNRSFAEQDLIHQVHQAVLQIGFDFCDELYAEGFHQLFEQGL